MNVADSKRDHHQSPAITDVLAVGHALVDVLAGAGDEFVEAEGLTKGEMRLIDADRARGLYQRMGPANEASGGSAANTATGVVACGGSAGFVGTVGDDQLGEIFIHDIRAAGVDYRTPPIPGEPTGRSMVLVTPDGERTMNTFIGAGGQVAVEHLDPTILAGAKITYVEGYLLDDRYGHDEWAAVIDIIHDAGRQFSITLSDSFCVERHRDVFLDLLDGSVDICFGNADEAMALFETDDFEIAATELSKRCSVAAITLGSKGSVLISHDERVAVPAELTNVVDTTGAGDLYAAGVLTGLARGWTLERCGRMGSRAAAAIISQMGARLARELPRVSD